MIISSLSLFALLHPERSHLASRLPLVRIRLGTPGDTIARTKQVENSPGIRAQTYSCA